MIEFLDLLCNMDALLLSVSFALTFIIVGQLYSFVSSSVVHKSNRPQKTAGIQLEKVMTDPRLVQNYCFIRDEIARKMFRKETPDDKEGHVHSLFA
ncbi:hypothetical protein AWM68_12825 [Fictibacillus phosphorivorans]|uniref:Uncharacterized protein n=1 Tax=Fictibacillus phosphorivorans TaxID=1221500 RepID=A0A161RRP9_9BACL|nr:hypothetical protein [Fictibacillus phosphorivorans]KZE63989.1 hypothetical protein AWM68_12825 [Fictibacillus phosphorivorans]